MWFLLKKKRKCIFWVINKHPLKSFSALGLVFFVMGEMKPKCQFNYFSFGSSLSSSVFF